MRGLWTFAAHWAIFAMCCLCLVPGTAEIDLLHGFSPQKQPKDSASQAFQPDVSSSQSSSQKTFSRQSSGKFQEDSLHQLPFPPLNYGQYNTPITQKDMSQDDFPYDQDHSGYTREIVLKQGRLKGVVRALKNDRLSSVEVFLGLPYAAPPVGSMRFMPPGSPPVWRGVRTFEAFGPVCPQTPPDLSNEPLRKLNQRRYNTLKVLLPFLANQSEDCLYLNIYAPVSGSQRPRKLPVMVYIHGESFDWNSGNPYDGSVMASYGQVIVVTVNFRLGILGFLRPGISDMTISNFGLLDQIAALQWVKDNIAAFGGDPGSVTLIGHGTGAACINFLMVSPVSTASDGLFQRAILMSGSALSDWALTIKPFQVTIQVAQALNCPMTDDELASCLRKKRLADILAVDVVVPEFETPFGPIVDGSVVPNTPDKLMGVYSNLFSRYELLYGMTEIESYHSLNVVSLTYGLLERERQQLLWQYMRARYEQMPDLALATTLSEYTNWRRAALQGSGPSGDADEHRDTVLDILSDARFAAPIVQMADYHSKANPKSYLYIFRHNSQFGEFAQMGRSIAGEELPYVFGVPISGGAVALSHHTFTIPEQLLSEVVLTYFTNFAKTGNPNAPHKTEYLTLGPRDWLHYGKDWLQYEAHDQSYLSIGIHMHTGHFYRHEMTQFWNKILPNRLANPPAGGNRRPVYEILVPSTSVAPTPAHRPNRPEFIFGKQANVVPKGRPPTSSVYGIVRSGLMENMPKEKKNDPMDGPMNQVDAIPTSRPDAASSSMALTLFSIIGVSFLIINIFAFSLLYYKRKQVQLERLQRQQGPPDQDADEVDDGGFEERERRRGCGLYDMVTGSRRGASRSEDTGVRLSRKCSSATLDPHTKVREWIIEKCSPAILRRGRRVYRSESQSELYEGDTELRDLKDLPNELKPVKNPPELKHQQSTQSEPLKIKKIVEKVSVEVDATPAARSASVLKQTPIELTKSLDRGLLNKQYFYCDEVQGAPPLRRSKTSVSLTLMSPTDDSMVKSSSDINVTSRDEILLRPDALLPGETLDNIKRRNFPKVLPDFPDKRLSLSFGRSRPAPPPRVSTLDRRHFQSSDDQDSVLVPEVKRLPKTVIVAHRSKPIVRKEPVVVIPPTIGPSQMTKAAPHVNMQQQSGKAHSKATIQVHLQQPTKRLDDAMPDSKGPSENKPPPILRPVIIDDLVDKSTARSATKAEPAKSLLRTNALDSLEETSVASSSTSSSSVGTVKKGKKTTSTAT